MKIIYLIRHSGPFVEFENSNEIPWDEFNKNMILSVTGEENARKLCDVTSLKNIKNIYSSNSFRAIGTAKYLAEVNDVRLRIDNRINEREFGIEYISDLPENFVINQFKDRNLKYENGESLNDVSKRFDSFIEEILNNGSKENVLFIHGIVLMNYLSEICSVNFDGEKFNVIFNDKLILDGKMKNPDIYKIVFDDNNKVVDVENIDI